MSKLSAKKPVYKTMNAPPHSMLFEEPREGIVYKLYCKDPKIKSFYIGSSIYTLGRVKKLHKSSVVKGKAHVYEYIRANGGYKNWDYLILDKVMINCKRDILLKALFWYNKLQPILNSHPPYTGNGGNPQPVTPEKKAEYLNNAKQKTTCECGAFVSKHHLKRHTRTKKHQIWLNERV